LLTSEWMKLREGAWVLLVPLVFGACGRSRHHTGAAGSGGTDAGDEPSDAGATGASAGDTGATTGAAGATTSETAGAANTGGSAGAGAAAGAAQAGTKGSLGGGSGAGAPGAGGAGTTNQNAAGAPSAPTIDVRAPSSPAACDPAVCNVVIDTEALEPIDLGDDGDFRIATSSDTTYLTLSSAHTPPSLVALGANGQQPIDQGLVPSMQLALVAVDANGEPHVAGSVLGPDSRVQELAGQAWDGTKWTTTTLGTRYARELEVGATNALGLFWNDDSGTYYFTSQGADGSLSQTTLFSQADDYALDARGVPALFADGSSSFGAFDVNGNELFNVQVPDEPANGFVEVRSAAGIPQALPPGAPDLASVALLPDGLHVVFANRTIEVVSDLVISDTTVPTATCPDDRPTVTGKMGDSCASPCMEHLVGLLPAGNPSLSSAYALARTADGAGWVAYVTEDMEGEVDYAVECPGDVGPCTCNALSPTGPTTWTLNVVRVAPDGGSFAPALNVELAPYLPTEDLVAWGVRARAFGRRVAIGAHIVESSPSREVGVRVVTLDSAP